MMPWKDEILRIIIKRQLDSCDDWKAFGEKLSGHEIEDFDIDKYRSEYVNAVRKRQGCDIPRQVTCWQPWRKKHGDQQNIHIRQQTGRMFHRLSEERIQRHKGLARLVKEGAGEMMTNGQRIKDILLGLFIIALSICWLNGRISGITLIGLIICLCCSA